jgi:two-component system sensor histidine kinase KdpD
MTLGPVLPGGRRALILISDDNGGANQTTRIVALGIPVEELVGSALQQESPVLARHRVDVRVPADLPLVRIDAVLMERVLCNLLENAAVPPPGTLVVRAGSRRRMEIWVADDGPGPRPGSRKIFGKFVRGDKVPPGVGLGLSICRAIAEAQQVDRAQSQRRQRASMLSCPSRPAPRWNGTRAESRRQSQ